MNLLARTYKAELSRHEREAIAPHWRFFLPAYLEYLLPVLMLFLLLLSGCASLETALKRLERDAVALDVVLDDRTDKWAEQVREVIERCQLQDLQLTAERMACLGEHAHAPEVVRYIELMAEMQHSIWVTVQQLEQIQRQLPEVFRK